MAKHKAKDPVKNRAAVARSAQRKRERLQAITSDVLHYMRREPIKDDAGNMKGYAVTFDFPDDAFDRFAQLAQEHNRTPQQLMSEFMEVYWQEAGRGRNERN